MGLGSALGYLQLTIGDEEGGEDEGSGGGGGSVARGTTPVLTSSSAAPAQGPGLAPASGPGLGSRKSRPSMGSDHTRNVLLGTVYQRLGHVMLQVSILSHPLYNPCIPLITHFHIPLVFLLQRGDHVTAMKSFLEALRIRHALFTRTPTTHHHHHHPSLDTTSIPGAYLNSGHGASPASLPTPVHPEILECVYGIALVQQALGRYGAPTSLSTLSTFFQGTDHHHHSSTTNTINTTPSLSTGHMADGSGSSTVPAPTHPLAGNLSCSDKVRKGARARGRVITHYH